MSTCPGPSCDRPAPRDATICAACMREMERDLGDIGAWVEELTRIPLAPIKGAVPCGPDRRNLGGSPHGRWFGRRQSSRWDAPAGDRGDIAGDLDLSLSRQAVMGYRNGRSRSSEIPLVFNEAAREARWVLDNTLTGMVRDLIESGVGDWPRDTPQSKAAFLLSHLADIRVHPAADEMADEIARALDLARRTVDRRAERVYAGPCHYEAEEGVPCPAELYAVLGAIDITCSLCGYVWAVELRRQRLLDECEDRYAHAALVSRALSSLDRPVDAATIRQWKKRGKLTVRGVDLDGRPLYRIGDVRKLLATEAGVLESSALVP